MNEKFNWFLPIFNNYTYKIQKIDVAKYFILYYYGGIYSDLDIEPRKNIKSLLNTISVMLVETPNVGLTNSLMASIKNSTFFYYLIHNIYDWKDLSKRLSPKIPAGKQTKVLGTTGSTALWGIYSMYNYLKNGYNDNSIRILNKQYFGKITIFISKYITN